MDDLFFVPATQASLSGWQGPVAALHLRNPPMRYEATLIQQDAFGMWVLVDWSHDCGPPIFLSAPTDRIQLDTRRAECRDRLARVIGGGPGCRLTWHPSTSKWIRSFRVGSAWYAEKPCGRHRGEQIAFPELAAFDPDDETLLPDGSRAVDALTLAAAARAKVSCG